MTILLKPRKYFKKVKSKSGKEILKKLEDYLKDNVEKPIQILCGFWKDQQDAITYQELREAIRDGTLDEKIFQEWSKEYSFLVKNQFQNFWNNAINAGSMSQSLITNLTTFSFHMQNSAVLHWITEHGAKFVTSSVLEQREAIQALLAQSVLQYHTIDELAKYLRPCIGLTKPQVKANLRYYENVVKTLKEQHPRMKTDSIQKKAREAATKYAERQHRDRAMTIAQTELAKAYNQGADFSIRQAQTQNLIGKVVKRWCTSGDDAVCDRCSSLEGVEIGMEDGFEMGKGWNIEENMTPPAHPRCACAVEYIEIESRSLYPLSEINQEGNLASNNLDWEERRIEHEKPKYLGTLENMSEDMVKSTLEKFEAEIVNSEIENAIVITNTGLIWQCFGNKEEVFPNIDLGAALYEAIVTHNHPIDSRNEYSFSDSDINLFMESNLKILRGIDEFYVYELTRNIQELDEFIPLFELEENDARHQMVIEMAQNLKIGYRRWKR